MALQPFFMGRLVRGGDRLERKEEGLRWTGVKRLGWRPGAAKQVRGPNVRRVKIRALRGGAALDWLFSWTRMALVPRVRSWAALAVCQEIIVGRGWVGIDGPSNEEVF